MTYNQTPLPDYGINLAKPNTLELTIRPEKDSWGQDRYTILDQNGGIYAATYTLEAANLIANGPKMLKALEQYGDDMIEDQGRLASAILKEVRGQS